MHWVVDLNLLTRSRSNKSSNKLPPRTTASQVSFSGSSTVNHFKSEEECARNDNYPKAIGEANLSPRHGNDGGPSYARRDGPGVCPRPDDRLQSTGTNGFCLRAKWHRHERLDAENNRQGLSVHSHFETT